MACAKGVDGESAASGGACRGRERRGEDARPSLKKSAQCAASKWSTVVPPTGVALFDLSVFMAPSTKRIAPSASSKSSVVPRIESATDSRFTAFAVDMDARPSASLKNESAFRPYEMERSESPTC